MNRLKGFTLIESVIVIVIMGIAMLTITSFLVPQITRSADPHYQTRAAALGQSAMSMILARGFDQQSDFIGGAIRCSSSDIGSTNCTGTTGSSIPLGPDSGETIATYNDVDDYIGCWEPNGTNSCQDLNLLVGDSATTYHNVRLDVEVVYQDAPSLKQITMTVSASNQQPLTFVALRGNY
ncbi:type II secretion system protein [Vibrio aquaticus]|uniref:Type II secretion system protein n=1 Tax=Vibrio aquaticus TaxID=2496559 RepID=A0A432CSY8_9VIBR|nr:type II secretion system protein [Vibrio aquaticus]RTZ14317.1 type II secretion system protein [Vibrio aquaticus]